MTQNYKAGITSPAFSSLTGQLVHLIRQKPVSQSDLEAAALFTLDAMANILAGRRSEPGRILLDWWRARPSTNGPAEPSALGFLAGALCHILETDDLHRASVVHPGCVVVPAVWAYATRQPVSGRDFLTAILHGFEATTRIGMAVGPAHYRIWHNTATCGPYGSAMAMAQLLGLDDMQAMNALGNAGSQSSGLWQFLETGAMTKHLHAGHAVEAGMRAAELAAFGFTGPPQILEGEKGFFRAACPDANPDAVLADRHAPWQLTLSSIKPWPSCRHTHPAIDAAMELRRHVKGDIATAHVETYQAALDVCDRRHATSEYEAKFSLQHTVAASLLRDHVDFAAFGDAARRQCADLAARITLEAADPWKSAYPNHWGARVTLTLTNGETVSAARTDAKGDPEAPLSRDEMVAKAQMLLTHGGVSDPDAFIAAVLALAQDGPAPELSVNG